MACALLCTRRLRRQPAHQLVTHQSAGVGALAQVFDVAGQMVDQVLLRQIAVAPGVVKQAPHTAGLPGIHQLPVAPFTPACVTADIQKRHRADQVIKLPVWKKGTEQKKPRPAHRVATPEQA